MRRIVTLQTDENVVISKTIKLFSSREKPLASHGVFPIGILHQEEGGKGTPGKRFLLGLKVKKEKYKKLVVLGFEAKEPPQVGPNPPESHPLPPQGQASLEECLFG